MTTPQPVIIGAGLAGLTVALSLAPMPVTVLSAFKLGEECSSAWAQGGLAAAVGADDEPAFHAADTLKAGAGLCDAGIVRQVTDDGAAALDFLIAYGVAFDRDPAGRLLAGLEAAHSHRRILHAGGDTTGRVIMRALIAATAAHPSIHILDDTVASDIVMTDGQVRGVEVERGGSRDILPASAVVLATGGAGALWRQTTNPGSSWGRGLALAARAGAVLGDLEFMQFHPTALDTGSDPMPLVTEALRGEGAILVDERAERFMAGQGRAELEPRDIVTRAIEYRRGEGHQVFLDARAAVGNLFPQRFPTIYARCMAAGIDPLTQPIPVRPAAHYHMGGVVTDARGRSSVPGLWACGEVACTGLHGANRLASNSLLEAICFGRRVAADIAGTGQEKRPMAPAVVARGRQDRTPAYREKIRDLMSEHVGVLRHRRGLETAITSLKAWAPSCDMALVGMMMAYAAWRREESRGAQARTDFPLTSTTEAFHRTLTLADAMRGLTPASQPRTLSAVAGG